MKGHEMLLSTVLSLTITGGLIGASIAGVRGVWRSIKGGAPITIRLALAGFTLVTGGFGVYTALIMWWKQINPIAWAFVFFFAVIGFVSIVDFASIEAGKPDNTESEA